MKAGRLGWTILFIVLLTVGLVPFAHAQSEYRCENGARIRQESRYRLDTEAVCAAAGPWQEEGIDIFVYLTDFEPQSEDAWFDHLDRVEVEAGLISADLSRDDFQANLLALEMTTAANSQYGISLTLGEALFDSPLDTDGAPTSEIKAGMLDALQREDPGGALVLALERGYEAVYSPSALARFMPIMVILILLLAAGGAFIYFYGVRLERFYGRLRGSFYRRRFREGQARLDRLIVLLEGLLAGEAGESGLLDELFVFYGGEQYPEMMTTAANHLRQARAGLDEVLARQSKLSELAADDMEEALTALENLYLALVGNRPRSRNLDDESLRRLLLPQLSEEDAGQAPQLAARLAKLEAAAQKSLVLRLQKVRLAEEDSPAADGVLDHIDHFKQLLYRLSQADEAAASRLAALQSQYEALRSRLPANFIMTQQQLFGGIEQSLAAAEAAMENEAYLAVMDQNEAVADDLALVEQFLSTLLEHEERRRAIIALKNEGYRPQGLANLENELAIDLQAVKEKISQGDYQAAGEPLANFGLESQFAVEVAEAWPALHRANRERLQTVQTTLARLQAYPAEKALPAWEKLQSYPEANWQDLAGYPAAVAQTLARAAEEQLPECARLNSLEVQQLEAAEAELGVLQAALGQAEYRLQAVVSRRQEIAAAAETGYAAISLSEAELKRARALRDAEDIKVSPEVDGQITRSEAQLEQAWTALKARNFVAALRAQSEARHLAISAHTSATDQISKINELLDKLNNLQSTVDAAAGKHLEDAQKMAAVVMTAAVGQAVTELESQWSLARIMAGETANLEDQAWAAALEEAILAYRQAQETAQKAAGAIQSARQEYEKQLKQARQALGGAQNAIAAARRARGKSGAGSAGKGSLNKAYSLIPDDKELDGLTKEALARIQREADQARRLADEAERQAAAAVSAYQSRQSTSNDSWSSWSSSSSLSSSSRSSSSSISRSSSSRSSSRSSGSTSSRRRR